jgi:hypothetical protein
LNGDGGGGSTPSLADRGLLLHLAIALNGGQVGKFDPSILAPLRAHVTESFHLVTVVAECHLSCILVHFTLIVVRIVVVFFFFPSVVVFVELTCCLLHTNRKRKSTQERASAPVQTKGRRGGSVDC